MHACLAGHGLPRESGRIVTFLALQAPPDPPRPPSRWLRGRWHGRCYSFRRATRALGGPGRKESLMKAHETKRRRRSRDLAERAASSVRVQLRRGTQGSARELYNFDIDNLDAY